MSGGTLLRVAAPLLTVVAVCLVLRVRGLPLRETLALRPPRPAVLAGWAGAFAVLAAVERVLEPWRGLPAAEPWGGRYGAMERAVRVVAMVLIAPVAEELVFRGAPFTRLERTRVGVPGAIALTAAFFAILPCSTARRRSA